MIGDQSLVLDADDSRRVQQRRVAQLAGRRLGLRRDDSEVAEGVARNVGGFDRSFVTVPIIGRPRQSFGTVMVRLTEGPRMIVGSAARTAPWAIMGPCLRHCRLNSCSGKNSFDCIDISIYYDILTIEKKGGDGPVTKIAFCGYGSIGKAAECLKVLAHPVRIRIVQLLLHARYTVGEIAHDCEIPENVASEHLRLMQRCGFFSSQREGRKVYYQVAEPHLERILECIESRFLSGTKSR